jgi:hypothetical protein
MDLGHTAASNECADLVPPAQQTSCTVHCLPSFLLSWPLARALALASWSGLSEASAGGAIIVALALVLVLGVAVWLDVCEVVAVTAGVWVLSLPPGRA